MADYLSLNKANPGLAVALSVRSGPQWLPIVFALIVVTGGGGAEQPQDSEKPAETIEERIALFVPFTRRLRVDGKMYDWRRLPRFRNFENPVNPGGLDVVEAAVAPLEEGVFVMARTRRKALRQDGNFWISLDLAGEEEWDFAVGLSWGRAHVLEIFTPGRKKARVRSKRIEAKQGAVLEVYIPYRALLDAIPSDAKAEHPLARSGGAVRSWVRARVSTWGFPKGKASRVDPGLAAASYLLFEGPSPKDPPDPKFEGTPVGIELPLSGTWYISQSAHGKFSHESKWAYDLLRLDAGHRSYRGLPPSRKHPLTDHYCFGAPIISPIKASIRRADRSAPDQPPEKTGKKDAANAVVVSDGKGTSFRFLHLKQRSIPDAVRAGAAIEKGRRLGLVGNSGYTTRPHLHLEARRANKTVPLAFENVRVRLNINDCPWEQEFDAWTPRDGFFVESATGSAKTSESEPRSSRRPRRGKSRNN